MLQKNKVAQPLRLAKVLYFVLNVVTPTLKGLLSNRDNGAQFWAACPERNS